MDYINYYMLWKQEHTVLYSKDFNKSLRETLKKSIQWDGSFPARYKIPFLSETDLIITIEYDYYCVEITKEINADRRTLLTTIGCFNEKSMIEIDNIIKSCLKSEHMNKDYVFQPVLPFVVNIPIFTPKTFNILQWTSTFCKALSWTILEERTKIQNTLNKAEATQH